MMSLAAFLLLSLAANLEVSVEPLSGVRQTGELVALSSEQLTIEFEGEQKPYELRDLLTVAVRHEGELTPPAPAVWIELIDGSRILAQQYTVKSRNAEIRLADRSLTIETHNIRSVRFQASADALEQQWQDLLAEERTGDVLVLRRSRTSLDQLTGVFQDVTEETVDFEYEEQMIPVKREKLEGIIYHHPVGRSLPAAICTVVDATGSSWKAKSLTLRDDQVELETSSGAKCSIPLESLNRFDFSAGNVAFLSDLEFDLAECTPFIASLVSPERLLQLYAPRRDNSYEGSGLWLGSGKEIQRYDRGLAIHSRSELVFRLTERYRKFTAVAGIDSRLQGRGNLVLIIAGDDRELLRRTISGKDAPLPLELDISGVRRLKILVDFGETLDVADHLNLCNARIVK